MAWGLASKGWTAVDGGDGSTLCAVSLMTAVRPGERPQVLAAVQAATDTGATDTATLQRLLSQTQRGLPQLVTLARSQYALRVMGEPAVGPREMANTLRWSLTVDSENPAEELNLAWMRIPTEVQLPTRPRQLYAITTPSNALVSLLAAWRPAGLRPKVVDIRETALRNIAALLERSGEGMALMADDPEGVGIVFTHQGSLYMDRYIPLPAGETSDADEAARTKAFERIASQLVRSVDVVNRSFPFMPVSRVVVAPMPNRPGLLEWLSEHVPLALEPLRLDEAFDLSQVPHLAESPELQARCLVPLGAALRDARGLA